MIDKADNTRVVFFCGKMGSGKSTTAQRMAQRLGAVLISEDDWLARLYPDEIESMEDYLRAAQRLKTALTPHLFDLLSAGVKVVMDFPGNTPQQRAWFKSLLNASGVEHVLYHLQAEDALCLERLKLRAQQQPQRAAFDNAETFHRVTRHFQPPMPEEGFNVVLIQQHPD